jgi:hypothetical protein
MLPPPAHPQVVSCSFQIDVIKVKRNTQTTPVFLRPTGNGPNVDNQQGV